jgi:MOSC domain-containing protein YiiM
MSTGFTLLSINISAAKGTPKAPVARATLREGHGIVGDAHAGDWHRQVSLLASEDIEAAARDTRHFQSGDFAENLTTRGVEVSALPVGTLLHVGSAILEITQIGKECHGSGCAIRQEMGDCVMPRRGVFARVVRGGEIDRESRCHYDL